MGQSDKNKKNEQNRNTIKFHQGASKNGQKKLLILRGPLFIAFKVNRVLICTVLINCYCILAKQKCEVNTKNFFENKIAKKKNKKGLAEAKA